MARATSANYTSSNFTWATTAADPFKKEDVQLLAQAVESHDHSSGKGTQVVTGGIAAQAVTAAKIANNTITSSQMAASSIVTAALAASNTYTTPTISGAVSFLDSGSVARQVFVYDGSNFMRIRLGTGNQLMIDNSAGTNMAIFDSSSNLTLVGTRVSFVSPFRAHRHPYASDRHIESGTINMGTVTPSVNTDSSAITFTDAFSSAPVVTVTCNSVGGADPVSIVCHAKSIGTTTFVIRVRNTDASNATNLTIGWHAEGAD